MSLVNTALPGSMYETYKSKRWILGTHDEWDKPAYIIMHKCHFWSRWYSVVLNPYSTMSDRQGGTCLVCKKKAPDEIITVAVLYNWDYYQNRENNP